MYSREELENLYTKIESEENIADYSEDIFKWYTTSINMRLLTTEEEKILLYQISLGDKRARKIFIKRNLKLVKTIASKYLNNGLDR